MPTPDTSHPDPRSFIVRRLLRIFLVLAALTVLAWGVALLVIDRKVRSAHEVAGQADPPLLPFDRFIPADLPEGTLNASDFLEAAAILSEGQGAVAARRSGSISAETHALFDRLRQLDLELAAPTAEELASFAEVVQDHAAALAVLDEAWEKDVVESRYDTNYHDVPASIIIPNLLSRLRLSQVLRARGLVALGDGRPAAAWRDAALLYRLADWTTHEVPALINALIGRAISRQGARLTQVLLRDNPPDAATRDLLLAEARRIEPRQLFSHVYGFEQSGMFLTLLDHRADGVAESSPSRHLLETISLTRRPWMRHNAALYHEPALPTFEICNRQSHTHGDGARTQLEQLAPPFWARPANEAFFVCLSASVKRDAWLAQLDQLEIALALEAVRENAGAYPADLAALGELGERVDPFSNAPYLYRQEGDGYRLWSVGGNRRDDGGVPAAGRRDVPDLEQGDLVWKVGA